ncbi:hypothetical protein [Actinomycetospora flava]|uniref:Uncharacterized protein n=1 Tax=Actinomycetospora flava TaxID=3129232 RepID=A0ABU8M5A2_9PSEU
MFRRPTTTARSARSAALLAAPPADEAPDGDDGASATAGPRHTRRARQRQADDAAALRARLDRVHRRLAEVGSVQVTGHVHAIDNATARRDPLTRPFAAAFPDAVGEQRPARRSVTAPLPRPA